LTVAAALRGGLSVVGVVVNNLSPGGDLATETNVAALRRWAGAPLLAEIPYAPVLDQDGLLSIAERFDYEVPVAGNQIHRG
jgi:dethiobiotin synthetase